MTDCRNYSWAVHIRRVHMKGVIFNLLEEVVSEHHGDASWDGLLAAPSNLTGTSVRTLLHRCSPLI